MKYLKWIIYALVMLVVLMEVYLSDSYSALSCMYTIVAVSCLVASVYVYRKKDFMDVTDELGWQIAVRIIIFLFFFVRIIVKWSDWTADFFPLQLSKGAFMISILIFSVTYTSSWWLPFFQSKAKR